MKLYSPIVLISLISLVSGCASLHGNVVPVHGPTMESVYDSLGHASISSMGMDTAKDARPILSNADFPKNQPVSTPRGFVKVLNPEISIYIYPHLVGIEGLPVPGYFTIENAYDHDFFMLAHEFQE